MMGTAIPSFVTEQTEKLIEENDPESDEQAHKLAENAAKEIVNGFSVGTQLAIIEQYRTIDKNPEIEIGTTTRNDAIARIAVHALMVDTYRRFEIDS